jgi:hypothetical protein
MPAFRGRRPSPAMIVASLALLIALSGTGIAAVTAALPRNSVGTVQLKNNAVTSAKVKNGSLTRSDFAAGTLLHGGTGATGPQGPPGSAGPQGVKGDKGDKGDSGAIGDVTVHTASVSVPAHSAPGTWANRSVQANCDSGEKGVSGGTNWAGEGDSTQLITVLSTPVYDSGNKKITGWRARGGNDTSSAHSFEVEVICTKS